MRDDLVRRLNDLADYKHDDLEIAGEAAQRIVSITCQVVEQHDEITRLRAELEAERERAEHYSDLLSQWRETWNNCDDPDGDLLDDTDAAVEGGQE